MKGASTAAQPSTTKPSSGAPRLRKFLLLLLLLISAIFVLVSLFIPSTFNNVLFLPKAFSPLSPFADTTTTTTTTTQAYDDVFDFDVNDLPTRTTTTTTRTTSSTSNNSSKTNIPSIITRASHNSQLFKARREGGDTLMGRRNNPTEIHLAAAVTATATAANPSLASNSGISPSPMTLGSTSSTKNEHPPPPAPTTTTTSDGYYYNNDINNISPDFRQALKQLGIEPAEDHEFKSPYVITPHLYGNHSNNGSAIFKVKAPGNRTTKLISVYNSPRWFKVATHVRYNRDFAQCPYSECQLDLLGHERATADLVLFFPGHLEKPPRRPPGQLWGFCSWESPRHYHYPGKTVYPLWQAQFEWAVSYRLDGGGLFMPMSLLAWRDRSTLLPYQDYVRIASTKTKTAAWWVSNCGTASRREDYVKEMQKYIDVDVYGRCGAMSCSKKHIEVCEDMLTTTYKFYLSFENSLCLDYVTEKFSRMFSYRTHIVPVGRSGFDYHKYIPGKFVVDASQFETAKDLALYLKALGNDTPRYARMLQEKDKLVSLERKVDWCDVCERLHTLNGSGQPPPRIPDIKAWSHNATCRRPRDIVRLED